MTTAVWYPATFSGAGRYFPGPGDDVIGKIAEFG
jgi:hypothetical protein